MWPMWKSKASMSFWHFELRKHLWCSIAFVVLGLRVLFILRQISCYNFFFPISHFVYCSAFFYFQLFCYLCQSSSALQGLKRNARLNHNGDCHCGEMHDGWSCSCIQDRYDKLENRSVNSSRIPNLIIFHYGVSKRIQTSLSRNSYSYMFPTDINFSWTRKLLPELC